MSATRARKIFLTGATGFIGSVVLDRLVTGGFDSLSCLARRPQRLREALVGHPEVRVVAGDLTDPATYASALAGVDTVLHMAAATGAASLADLQRVNVLGTQRLLEACVGHDVGRIVYISSIAAGYADLSGYPYGRTKLEAETLVRRSPLEHVVLRPTIVLGERGPTWTMLRKLACLPFVPVFAGGRTEVQPVDVADVARGVAALLDDFQPKRTIDLGGPEVVTFGNLLRRIRRACGHAGGLLVPIPLWPVRSLLDLANVMLPGRLPVGAAQLVPFVQDGKAQPSSLYEQLRPSMTSLDALLFRIAHAT